MNSKCSCGATLQVFDFELTDDDMSAINRLNRDLRLIVPVVERNGFVVADVLSLSCNKASLL